MQVLLLFIVSLSPIDVEIVPSAAAEQCPDSPALDADAAEHVAQTVSADARWHARIRFEHDSDWHARIVLTDARGTSLGARALRSASEDCVALARAVAFSLAFSWLSAHPNHAHPLFAELGAPQKKTARGLQLALGGVISGFAVPALGYGVVAEAGFRAQRWSIAGAFEWQGASAASGGVNITRTAGGVMPCGRWGRWSGCAVLSGGGIMSSGPHLSHNTVPWWGAAARVVVETPLSEHFSATLFAQLGLQSTTRVFVDTQVAWQSPPLWLTLGLNVNYFHLL